MLCNDVLLLQIMFLLESDFLKLKLSIMVFFMYFGFLWAYICVYMLHCTLILINIYMQTTLSVENTCNQLIMNGSVSHLGISSPLSSTCSPSNVGIQYSKSELLALRSNASTWIPQDIYSCLKEFLGRYFAAEVDVQVLTWDVIATNSLLLDKITQH